jgi:uncharacterized membrane protein
LTDTGDELEGRGDAAPSETPRAEGVDPGTLEAAVLHMERHVFSGPLPPPAVLARYNDALPGGAERIVALAEKQAQHRRQMESRGQLLLFAVVLVALVGGIMLIAIGKDAAGLVPVIAALGGLGSLFVYREVKTRRLVKELEGDEG